MKPPEQELVEFIARLTKDGEKDENGDEFVMENDDAVNTIHGLITRARQITRTPPANTPENREKLAKAHVDDLDISEVYSLAENALAFLYEGDTDYFEQCWENRYPRGTE